MGHRSSLGLAVHPGTGEMWQNENGPNGGDEINILRPGAQLRLANRQLWASLFRSLAVAIGGLLREGFEQPIVYWTPAIAVSGMAFYTGDRLPKWKGDVFVGITARRARFPGRVTSNESCSTRRWRSCDGSRCSPLRQRIRDVRQGPDGLLYLLTDEDNGAVLRIEPAQ